MKHMRKCDIYRAATEHIIRTELIRTRRCNEMENGQSAAKKRGEKNMQTKRKIIILIWKWPKKETDRLFLMPHDYYILLYKYIHFMPICYNISLLIRRHCAIDGANFMHAKLRRIVAGAVHSNQMEQEQPKRTSPRYMCVCALIPVLTEAWCDFIFSKMG